MRSRIAFALIMLFCSPASWALSVSLQPAEKGVVRIVIDKAPPIYGGDVTIAYDPQFFEVVDQDSNRRGTQIQAGDFFPKEANVLDNRIDIRKGEIHYVAALVRPMQDVSGDGVIASIRFKAKRSGPTQLVLKHAQFGTQEGALHKAEPFSLSLIADASGQLESLDLADSEHDAQNAPLSIEALLMAVITVLLLIVIVLLLRKK